MSHPQAYIEIGEEGSEYPMLVIRSTGGKRFYLTIDDSGLLTTTEIE